MSSDTFSRDGGDDAVDERVEVGVAQTPTAEERPQRAELADPWTAEDGGVHPRPVEVEEQRLHRPVGVEPRPVDLDGDVVAAAPAAHPDEVPAGLVDDVLGDGVAATGQRRLRRVGARGVLGGAHDERAGRVEDADLSGRPGHRRPEDVAGTQAHGVHVVVGRAGGDRDVVGPFAAGAEAAGGVERVGQERVPAADQHVVATTGERPVGQQRVEFAGGDVVVVERDEVARRRRTARRSSRAHLAACRCRRSAGRRPRGRRRRSRSRRCRNRRCRAARRRWLPTW